MAAMIRIQSHFWCRRIVPIIQNLKFQSAHPNRIQRNGSNAKLNNTAKPSLRNTENRLNCGSRAVLMPTCHYKMKKIFLLLLLPRPAGWLHHHHQPDAFPISA